jgi:hypothetical protein
MIASILVTIMQFLNEYSVLQKFLIVDRVQYFSFNLLISSSHSIENYELKVNFKVLFVKAFNSYSYSLSVL